MSNSTVADEQSTPKDSYEIRPYERADRDGVLKLDRIVWSRRRSPEWFAWKYEQNPYVSDLPIHVAEYEGEIVGARPLLAFRLRVGDSTQIALQPADTMVHPDHRGRGLFTRMTEQAIERYADREPTLFFNFPNRQAQPGYEKLGWREAGTRTTYYRIQNPEPLVSSLVDERLDRYADVASGVAGSVGSTLASGFNAVHDWFADDRSHVSVRRRDDVPAELLASLYRRAIPEKIHAVRDEAFYRWRFASPVWDRKTYLAEEDGDIVAAVIVRTRTNTDGVRWTQVAEVVPLGGGRRWLDALARLFGQLLSDHRRSHIVTVPGSVLPHEFLTARGFRPNDRLPLSRLKSYHRTIAVRPIDDLDPESWRIDGVSLTDPSNWLVSYGERDTT
ncbi:GNAT family N-acetyltransferase [Halorussus halophilus]|uniref:GNAT family N-acetyltransferase n=1 Tax=Halorussus halophilus TaxID=2650975 RepID=UPI00130122A2|nr:GNAT family N-acetyltransferase [Halorussus halophilus]